MALIGTVTLTSLSDGRSQAVPTLSQDTETGSSLQAAVVLIICRGTKLPSRRCRSGCNLAGVPQVLLLCLAGLVAGTGLGLFGRAVALGVAMMVFGVMITSLAALANVWSVGQSLLGFVGVVVAFQMGFLLAAGLHFAVSTPARRHYRKAAPKHLS